jgi:3',5'-cyclic AMP phosphodiesterase CpdA
MKKISGVVLCIVFHLLSFSQAPGDSLQARIILIGDAGELTPDGKHPVVAAVRNNMKLDKKTTIIYLGDNLYKAGLPDVQSRKYTAAKAVLDSQLNVAKGTDAQVYFIPGNHDWDEYGADGWEAVKRQQEYINAAGDKNVFFFPEDGCPGPVLRNISDEVVLIMIDSQWWLHDYDKPGIESDCDHKTKLEVLKELEDMLARNAKKLVILAMHHPLKSNGIHGGYY